MRRILGPTLGAFLFLSTATAAPVQAAPASTPAPRAAPTAQFLDNMRKLITTKGVDRSVNVSFAHPLGLKTEAGQDWPDHQIGADVSGDKTTHAFAVSRGTDPDLVLFARRADGNIYVFRSSRDGKSLGCLITNRQTRTITMRDAAGCQQELDDEFDFWARSVDKLLTSG